MQPEPAPDGARHNAPEDPPNDAHIRFHRLIATARAPQRADRSACGILPARAVRYCEALTSASAFGYYLFAPMRLSLLWDGADIAWTYPGIDRWLLLDAAQFPHFARNFDTAAPADLEGMAPPFLQALPEPGVVQLWTGLFARTRADWSLLLRPVANFPQAGFVPYEGIVETDRWFGPLFTNLRLTRTGVPVTISADVPLIQAQPLPRSAYDSTTLDRFTLHDGLAGFEAADWDGYRRSVALPNARPDRPLGGYAIAARRRARAL